MSDPATPNELKRPHLEAQYEDPVEAGCKSLVGQRLKLSGMRWTIPGATGIVTLRCQDADGRWDEIWQRPCSQTVPADTAILAS